MSNQFKIEDNYNEVNSHGRVKVTDLISRLNQEKRIERKRNLALGAAAFSTITVFAIILTL